MSVVDCVIAWFGKGPSHELCSPTEKSTVIMLVTMFQDWPDVELGEAFLDDPLALV